MVMKGFLPSGVCGPGAVDMLALAVHRRDVDVVLSVAVVRVVGDQVIDGNAVRGDQALCRRLSGAQRSGS